MKVSHEDARLVRAAASAMKHAPEHMRAGHLVDRLEEFAKRIELSFRNDNVRVAP
jgi:hypothetical protein